MRLLSGARGGSLCLIILSFVSSVRAELSATQIAVLANGAVPESVALAQYYAKSRGLDTDQVIELELPTGENISREQYETGIVRPVRRALEQRNVAARIRGLVTTYGIPLRVASPVLVEDWAKDAAARQERAKTHLEGLEEWLKRLPHPAASTERPDAVPANPSVVERVGEAIRGAAARLAGMSDRSQVDQARVELTQIITQFGGITAILQTITPEGSREPHRTREELEKARQQVATAERMIELLKSIPSEKNRQRAYRLTEWLFGARGVLALTSEELDPLKYKDGDASVDSELSLLWWDPNSYRIAGRMTNPLFAEASSNPPTLPPLPVLMISRLDAPTAQLAMQLVDRALQAEQHGLSGKIYVDAQGQKPGPPLSYGFFDQSLREFAALARRTKSYKVILEDTERRFSKPGEAPDVAIYVGWYRLRFYEDAFTFNPGAIGYHIASGEAVSLHDPAEPGWCKNALEHGITVTLGSTGEPFLDAFPLPDAFLGLLFTGRYSLVEAYYLTTRYVSWRMVLIGDPLYNPWRGKPLSAGASSPTPPSELSFPNPIPARRQLKEQQETSLAEIDRFLKQLEQKKPPSPK